jgi:hypothetical protein
MVRVTCFLSFYLFFNSKHLMSAMIIHFKFDGPNLSKIMVYPGDIFFFEIKLWAMLTNFIDERSQYYDQELRKVKESNIYNQLFLYRYISRLGPLPIFSGFSHTVSITPCSHSKRIRLSPLASYCSIDLMMYTSLFSHERFLLMSPQWTGSYQQKSFYNVLSIV